jgi:ABC-type amino acid transport substrate-binding protein
MRPLTFVCCIRPRQSLAALTLLLAAAGAWAQAGTLDKIRQSGTISLGYREASIPFSYVGENRQPAGYSVELCQRVAESVKQQLGLADLKIAWVQVAPGNRMAKLASAKSIWSAARRPTRCRARSRWNSACSPSPTAAAC